MTLKEFEEKLQEIRSKNGWIIHLECRGIWVITVEDKETEEILGETGATDLGSILFALKRPFSQPPWV